MFHQEDGGAAISDGFDQIHDLLTFVEVHARDRFVQQQQQRSRGQRHGDAQRTLAAVGQILCQFISIRCQPGKFQDFMGAGDFLAWKGAEAQQDPPEAPSAGQMKPQEHIRQHRHVQE